MTPFSYLCFLGIDHSVISKHHHHKVLQFHQILLVLRVLFLKTCSIKLIKVTVYQWKLFKSPCSKKAEKIATPFNNTHTMKFKIYHMVMFFTATNHCSGSLKVQLNWVKRSSSCTVIGGFWSTLSLLFTDRWLSL